MTTSPPDRSGKKTPSIRRPQPGRPGPLGPAEKAADGTSGAPAFRSILTSARKAVSPVSPSGARAVPDAAPQSAPAPQSDPGTQSDPAPARRQGQKPKRKKPGGNRPPRPVARPARMHRRHWGLGLSFVAVVGVPLLLCILYVWIFAVDQYASVTGFTVRQDEGGGASDLLGGLTALTGGNASSDGDILYEFIQGQDIVRSTDAELDLVAHYTDPMPRDPVFALWQDPSIEDLQDYWQRMVRINFDQSSGLIDVRVLAFTPEMARGIAQSVLRRSQDMINDLNLQAREDAMGYARADLEEALARLKTAREALTQFRTRTQIVDPAADLQGRMGVMSNLQQQLAEALINYDLLQQTTNADDPRLRQGQQRIDVIRRRITDERESFATEEGGAGPVGEDYPTLIAEFEGLSVDREFAEETYRAALAALDLARAEAQRQSRYLATYIPPTFPETSQYPRRFVIIGVTGLFLVLLWSVMALVYYSIRDRG